MCDNHNLEQNTNPNGTRVNATNEKTKNIKILIKQHPYIFSAITSVICFFLGLAGQDVYNLKIKPHLFPTKPEISFKSISTSTLKQSYSINEKNYYYVITSFRVQNIGDYKTKKGYGIKIQPGGEILGITPKGLESSFKINAEDKTTAIFDLTGLEPRGTINGEIHSLSKMIIDREEVQIGIDPIGDFKLIGPNLL